jgi:cytochrome b
LDHSSSELPERAPAPAPDRRLPRSIGGEPAFRWKGSWSGWPIFVRILLWSTRNSRSGDGLEASEPRGALEETLMSDARTLPPASVRVWDWPVIIVHWAIAVLVALAYWAVETGQMAWHYRFGYALAGLLVFRLIWGFAGSSTARFASFVKGPRRVIEYLRGSQDYVHGHSPLGALSIIALLSVLAIQIGLGLFASNGNGSKAGPFADLIAPGTAHVAAELHKVNFYLLLGLIGLHVAAVLFYLLVRRNNLIAPMLTGRHPAPNGTQPVATAPAAHLFIAVAIAAGVAIWLIAGS